MKGNFIDEDIHDIIIIIVEIASKIVAKIVQKALESKRL